MRDIPWVDDTGRMTVRTVDDDGNFVEDVKEPELFGGAAPARDNRK